MLCRLANHLVTRGSHLSHFSYLLAVLHPDGFLLVCFRLKSRC